MTDQTPQLDRIEQRLDRLEAVLARLPPGSEVEVARASAEAARAFGAGAGTMLHMVLRVGVPTRSLPVAGRLSPDRLIISQ